MGHANLQEILCTFPILTTSLGITVVLVTRIRSIVKVVFSRVGSFGFYVFYRSLPVFYG